MKTRKETALERETDFWITLVPFYKTIHYKTISLKDDLKVDPRSIISKQKCKDFIAKWPFMIIFLHNLYIFVWIQYGSLANTAFALAHSCSVIKRLSCIYKGNIFV